MRKDGMLIYKKIANLVDLMLFLERLKKYKVLRCVMGDGLCNHPAEKIMWLDNAYYPCCNEHFKESTGIPSPKNYAGVKKYGFDVIPESAKGFLNLILECQKKEIEVVEYGRKKENES